jgi:hypothetical protein
MGYGDYLTRAVKSSDYNHLGLKRIQAGDSAITYRAKALGVYLRKEIREATDNNSTWLASNLVLADVFKRGGTDFGRLIDIGPAGLNVKTPSYFGYIAYEMPRYSKKGEIVLSQDVSVGRSLLDEELPSCSDLEDELQAVAEYLVNYYYPDVRIHVDSAASNLLVGPGDIMKIDCDGMFSSEDEEVSLWRTNQLHYG